MVTAETAAAVIPVIGPVVSIAMVAITTLFGIGKPKSPPPTDAWVQGTIDQNGIFTYTTADQSGPGNPAMAAQPMQAAAANAISYVAQLGGKWTTEVNFFSGYDGAGWNFSGAGVGANNGLGYATPPTYYSGANKIVMPTPATHAETSFIPNPVFADYIARWTLGAMLMQTWPDPNVFNLLGGQVDAAVANSGTGISAKTAQDVANRIGNATAYLKMKSAGSAPAGSAAAGLQTSSTGVMLPLLALAAAIYFL